MTNSGHGWTSTTGAFQAIAAVEITDGGAVSVAVASGHRRRVAVAAGEEVGGATAVGLEVIGAITEGRAEQAVVSRTIPATTSTRLIPGCYGTWSSMILVFGGTRSQGIARDFTART